MLDAPGGVVRCRFFYRDPRIAVREPQSTHHRTRRMWRSFVARVAAT